MNILHEVSYSRDFLHWSQDNEIDQKNEVKNRFWLECDRDKIYLFCSVILGGGGIKKYKYTDLGTAIQDMVFLNNKYKKFFKKLDKFTEELKKQGYKNIN